MKCRSIYSVYKKDNILFTGTSEEISKYFNVKIKTVYDWACPSAHKIADKGKIVNGKRRKRETTGIKIAVKIN